MDGESRLDKQIGSCHSLFGGNTKAISDGSRNFEVRKSAEDDIRGLSIPSQNYHTTPMGLGDSKHLTRISLSTRQVYSDNGTRDCDTPATNP
ncbi:hypothetical protein TNCV_3008001 [Trichonephila clavipes]|nr:hypothetical protein TNCV_3008001 [Trichonephila clavipes]